MREYPKISADWLFSCIIKAQLLTICHLNLVDLDLNQIFLFIYFFTSFISSSHNVRTKRLFWIVLVCFNNLSQSGNYSEVYSVEFWSGPGNGYGCKTIENTISNNKEPSQRDYILPIITRDNQKRNVTHPKFL